MAVPREIWGIATTERWIRKRLCTSTRSRSEPVIGFITCSRLLSASVLSFSFHAAVRHASYVSIDIGRAVSSKRKESRASSEVSKTRFPRWKSWTLERDRERERERERGRKGNFDALIFLDNQNQVCVKMLKYICVSV